MPRRVMALWSHRLNQELNACVSEHMQIVEMKGMLTSHKCEASKRNFVIDNLVSSITATICTCLQADGYRPFLSAVC